MKNKELIFELCIGKPSEITMKFDLRGRTRQLVSPGRLSPTTGTSVDHSGANSSEFKCDNPNAAAGTPSPCAHLPEDGGSPASRPATAPVQVAKPG